ncbi:aminoglycoside phosphotransferase family protein [Streptacidiphilus cavernicola]|uniref:Aminoglycoside phosphotransferase family protein n=1 Tax=Streptacidiphilus cavernicola TaxID=3342716 RepID=A0ABV6VN22_9ACTN
MTSLSRPDTREERAPHHREPPIDRTAETAAPAAEACRELVDSVRLRVRSEGGFHNRNYQVRPTDRQARLLGLGSGQTVLVRVRRSSPELVQRVWPDEAALLRRLAAIRADPADGRGPDGPRVLHSDDDGTAVHLYVSGETFARRYPDGLPVQERHVAQIAWFFGRLTQFQRSDLPELPKGWPEDGDSTGFLRARVRFAQERLCDANQGEFGDLFSALGVPGDAISRFGEALPPLTERPFALLHTDVHRRNIIVADDDRLRFVDWELAMFGDPLHDLAVHLRRMRYPAAQERQVVAAWEEAVIRTSPEHAVGLGRDLRHYRGYELAQSVYPDVIRAALSLGAMPEDRALDWAVTRAQGALAAAAGPLRLRAVPDRETVRSALVTWHHTRWFERSLTARKER